MTTVVVFGTGSIGTRHLEVLQEIEGVSSIAIPKRQERAKELSSSGYNVAIDLDQAVDQGATHCIIASETGNHVAHCQLALELGLEVLVEKPAAVDALGARKLSTIATNNNRHLYVGCVMRFTESLNTFKDLLPEAGRLHSVRIECQSYMPDWRPHRAYHDSYAAQPLEGGVLLDLIHEIDYASWIFGWPTAVHARMRNMGILGIAEDEATDVSWEIENHLQVSIFLDYLSKPARRIMRAYGDRGTLEWDGIAKTVTLTSDASTSTIIDSNQERNETFIAQTKAFIQATKSPFGNQDPRLASISEGGMSLSICDAARLASTNRRDEMVAYYDRYN